MFKFRFLDEDISPNDNTQPTQSSNSEWFEAKEVIPDLDIIKKILATGSVNLFRCSNEVNLKYVASNLIDIFIEKTNNSPILKAEKGASDLVTGVYEGGLKIWECTYDLAKYIQEYVSLANKTVLDVGCGAGIIGILALVNGSKVCFQDYNEEIVKYVTIPNVFLNKSGVETPDCKFFSGDWNSFLSLTSTNFETDESKFDYIFTCETIYNPESYKKLHTIFVQCLKNNGIIYLAAKTHYFGVGGGLRQFEDFMREESLFNFTTCWKCTEGVTREILKISFKNLDRV